MSRSPAWGWWPQSGDGEEALPAVVYRAEQSGIPVNAKRKPKKKEPDPTSRPTEYYCCSCGELRKATEEFPSSAFKDGVFVDAAAAKKFASYGKCQKCRESDVRSDIKYCRVCGQEIDKSRFLEVYQAANDLIKIVWRRSFFDKVWNAAKTHIECKPPE